MCQRKTGRSERSDPASGDLLNGVDRPDQVLPEFRRRLLVGKLMQVGMASHLQSQRLGFPEHFRILLGDPSYAEEGGLLAPARKQIQNAVGVFMDTAFVGIPLRFTAGLFVVENVEPFFYVKRQDIYRPAPLSSGATGTLLI